MRSSLYKNSGRPWQEDSGQAGILRIRQVDTQNNLTGRKETVLMIGSSQLKSVEMKN